MAESRVALKTRIRAVIAKSDFDEFQTIVAAHPDLRVNVFGVGTWLHVAVEMASVEFVNRLIESGGYDVNAIAPIPYVQSPLEIAVRKGNLPMIELLLRKGANPNVGRPAISAIPSVTFAFTPALDVKPVVTTDPTGLQILQQLVDAGLDVNNRYDYLGTGYTFSALDFAVQYGQTEIAEYLRSLGATESPPLTLAEKCRLAFRGWWRRFKNILGRG